MHTIAFTQWHLVTPPFFNEGFNAFSLFFRTIVLFALFAFFHALITVGIVKDIREKEKRLTESELENFFEMELHS